MLSRDDALHLLKAQDPDQSLFNHAQASEAVMAALAARLAPCDQEAWSRTGLLHDLDFPLTKQDPARHGPMAVEMLGGQLPPEALQAILAHNEEYTGIAPQSTFDYALRCAEAVTGLVFATAYVRPQGFEGMKASSLKKKMKDKAFAANVSRDRIRECEQLGLSLDEFLALSIEAMAGLACRIGIGVEP
ncbi:HD family phosphohydrolase [Megalodesulfovibrio paquesii]